LPPVTVALPALPAMLPPLPAALPPPLPAPAPPVELPATPLPPLTPAPPPDPGSTGSNGVSPLHAASTTASDVTIFSNVTRRTENREAYFDIELDYARVTPPMILESSLRGDDKTVAPLAFLANLKANCMFVR
jgi:hypothetical protein